MNRTK